MTIVDGCLTLEAEALAAPPAVPAPVVSLERLGQAVPEMVVVAEQQVIQFLEALVALEGSLEEEVVVVAAPRLAPVVVQAAPGPQALFAFTLSSKLRRTFQ